MLPKNFPERKQERRRKALKRAGVADWNLPSLQDVRTKKHLADASPARKARHGGKLGRAR